MINKVPRIQSAIDANPVSASIDIPKSPLRLRAPTRGGPMAPDKDAPSETTPKASGRFGGNDAATNDPNGVYHAAKPI